MRPNPRTPDGSWYPNELLAYHAVFGDSREGFTAIFSQGELRAAAYRPEAVSSTSLYWTDRAAGDDEYVFLSLGAPQTFRYDPGYLFVVDPVMAIEELTAIVGEKDLDGEYLHLVDKIMAAHDLTVDARNAERYPNVVSDFTFEVAELVSRFRHEGDTAMAYLRTFWEGRAPRSLPPEMLIPEGLEMADCRAFIWDRVFIEAADFSDLFETGGFPPVGRSRVTTRLRGFPLRCPLCGGPVVKVQTLAQLDIAQPWRRDRTTAGDIYLVLYCESHDGYMVEDQGDLVETTVNEVYDNFPVR